jgi:hypothetical protein
MVKPLADAWAKFNRAKVHAQEVLAQWPRNPSVQYECDVGMNVEPWGCAKAFVKRVLTKTGVMLFEEPLKAIDKDNFLGKYFVPPGEFQRPGIPMTF